MKIASKAIEEAERKKRSGNQQMNPFAWQQTSWQYFQPAVGIIVYCGEPGWTKWPAVVAEVLVKSGRKSYHVKYIGKRISSCAAFTFDRLEPF